MEAWLDDGDPLNERQFRIAVKRLADNLCYGADRSPFLGSGIEFAQSRPYELGDPIKAIDWRVTARTGIVHIKEYEAPKRIPVYLLIDTSASMTVGSRVPTKYAWAVRLAGGIALACLQRMSPVGVLGVGERDLRLEPSLSRDRVYEWVLRLRRYRTDERTILAARLAELSPSMTHRALLIVLTDLHDPQALPALKLLAQRHDCVVLQLEDPAERGLKGAGIFRAREAETGRVFTARGRTRWIDQEALARELKSGRVDHLLLRIDEPFLPKLAHFLRTRDKLGRGAR
jgi:uncharacterized protein (DUF58 family)